MLEADGACADRGKQKELGLVAGMPWGFANIDTEFEGGRWRSWPPAPGVVKFLARDLTFWVHRDWWKFSSCGRDGKMQPLYALASKTG